MTPAPATIPEPADDVNAASPAAQPPPVVCPTCRYDLTGTAGAGLSVCPECGRPFSIVAVEPERAGFWLPLVVTLAMGTGTGLTYPLYVWFNAETLDVQAVTSLSGAIVMFVLTALAVVTRRRLARFPRAVSLGLVGLGWVVILLFWAFWADAF